MACFLVPMFVAVVLSVVMAVFRGKIPANYRLGWLNLMLWGGVVGLALEHYAHEEIVPYPPYLSAMISPEDTAVMLHEMATIGSAMTIAIIAVWVIVVVVSSRLNIGTSSRKDATV